MYGLFKADVIRARRGYLSSEPVLEKGGFYQAPVEAAAQVAQPVRPTRHTVDCR